MKLRELKTLGFHFRRQAPIGRYIVDFVSFRSRLVIEADGGHHGLAPGAQADQVRDAFLLSQGLRVLRFWNSDIDDNIAGVMESVLNALNRPPPDWPSASHPRASFARLDPTASRGRDKNDPVR
jgi:very-short-patch-repair endonuclease